MSSGLGPHLYGQPQQIVVRLLPPLLERSDFCAQLAEYFPSHDSISHMYYVRGENPRTPYEKPVYLRAYLTFNLPIAFSSCHAALKDKPFLDVGANDSMVPQLQHGLFCKLWERPPPVDAEPQPLFADSRFFQHFLLLLPSELTNYDIMKAAKELQKKKKPKKDSQNMKEPKPEKTAVLNSASKTTKLQKKGSFKPSDEHKLSKKSKKLSKREKLKGTKPTESPENKLPSREKPSTAQSHSSESTLTSASPGPSKKQAKKQRALERAAKENAVQTSEAKPTSPAKPKEGGKQEKPTDGQARSVRNVGAPTTVTDMNNGYGAKPIKKLVDSSFKPDKPNFTEKKSRHPKKGGHEGLDKTKTTESGKALTLDSNEVKSRKKRPRSKKTAKASQPQD